MYAKTLEHTQRNVLANFEIPLIFKILGRYFTEMFYYCFIEISFVVCLLFCGDTGGVCVYFFTILVFKCFTKLDRLKFVNSVVL